MQRRLGSARVRRLLVYYRFVTPGPGEFIIQARLVSTNRSDTRAGDDAGSVTIVATAPRLTLGQPRLAAGVPVAGRRLPGLGPVRRAGEPVLPAGATCAAAVGAASSPQRSRRSWLHRLRMDDSVGFRRPDAADDGEGDGRPLAVSGTWLYAIQKP